MTNSTGTNSGDSAFGTSEPGFYILGALGLSIYSLLLVGSAIASTKAVNRYARFMFVSSVLSAAFAIPRYAFLVQDRAYTNQSAYALHLFSSAFFFWAFCFLCFLFNNVMDLSVAACPTLSLAPQEPEKRRLFMKNLLFSRASFLWSNIAFDATVFCAAVYCIKAVDLYAFFQNSDAFTAYLVIDMFTMVLYCPALCYYGYKLRAKIMEHKYGHMSINERLLIGTLPWKMMEKGVSKLLTISTVCLAAFTLRVVMILLEIFFVDYSLMEPNTQVKPYGVLWWTLADLVPKAIPMLSFLVFFGNSEAHRKSSARSQSLSTTNSFNSHSVLGQPPEKHYMYQPMIAKSKWGVSSANTSISEGQGGIHGVSGGIAARLSRFWNGAGAFDHADDEEDNIVSENFYYESPNPSFPAFSDLLEHDLLRTASRQSFDSSVSESMVSVRSFNTVNLSEADGHAGEHWESKSQPQPHSQHHHQHQHQHQHRHPQSRRQYSPPRMRAAVTNKDIRKSMKLIQGTESHSLGLGASTHSSEEHLEGQWRTITPLPEDAHTHSGRPGNDGP